MIVEYKGPAMSTKDEIQAAAMKSHRTVEVEIGTAKATLRELSRDERRALDQSNYQHKDGEFLTKEENGESYLVPVEEKESRHAERWIAATISPAFTVEEIAPWPASLKARLLEEARRVNGIEPAEKIAKNS